MAQQTWLNQLLGGLSGAGKGLELQQQYRRQREQDVQGRELHQAQLGNIRAQEAQRTAEVAQHADTSRILATHWKDAIGGDPDAQAAIVSRVPSAAQYFAPKPKTSQRHYDSDRGGFVDADTGAFIPIPGLPPRPAKEPSPRYTFQTVLGPDGTPHIARGNTLTGALEDTGYGAKATSTPRPTESQLRAQLVYPRAAESAKVLQQFYDKGAPASTFLQKIPLVGNYFTPEESQQLNAAAEAVASSILRLESGAAVTEGEARSYAKQFLPQPGDDHATLEQKRSLLATQLERMRMVAESATPHTPTASPSPAPSPAPQSKLPLSARDKAMAKRDPKFAAHLVSSGYVQGQDF